MKQHHHDQQPKSRSEIITLLSFMGIFLLLMALDIFNNYTPTKLAALFFILWWMPLVFVHEYGHALMARGFGWDIQRTVIGFGRVIYEGRLFNAPLELRLFPIEGFVQFEPRANQASGSWRQALIYFAGPGIELLVFFILLAIMGVDNFFFIEDNYSKLALQVLGFAALAGAVINLIPIGVTTKEGEVPNDGLGILLSLFGSNTKSK
ncbi:site-2 protease family protein [Thiolinea disciformis]|uniref:site-2 protease family protein n=1 Tax=Thiolinea disciformis TaxID=125614 RepID=UPI00037C07D7|nr:site-2 protease family protein [Thiolinea disciformis]